MALTPLPMMRAARLLLLLLTLLPLTAAERAAFGVVALDVEPQIHRHLPLREGAVVDGVWPGSPADKAGIRSGAVITAWNGTLVRGRDHLAQLLAAQKPGDTVRVGLFVEGVPRTVSVRLIKRPARTLNATAPEQAIAADRVLRPVEVSPAIRKAMLAHRETICAQLASLPEPFDRELVTDELQAIRNLARDANAADRSWMGGKAGESALQFRDSEGSLQLRGADNSVTLEVYDRSGRRRFVGKLDTPAQRRALPEEVLRRLRRLK